MNQITIAGHLGADPEVRFTSSGQKVTTVRIAARARKGSKGDDTIWWRVTIWGEQFDKMIPYLKKGSPLIVVGELSKPEIFTSRDGQPQVSMNITAHNLLFSPFGKPDGQNSSHAESYDQGSMAGNQEHPHEEKQFGQGQQQQEQTETAESLADEEIPF